MTSTSDTNTATTTATSSDTTFSLSDIIIPTVEPIPFTVHGLTYYRNAHYVYQDRQLGRLINVQVEDRYNWSQYRFEFTRETLFFNTEDDTFIDQLLLVSS